MSAGEFQPYGTLTRAAFVTMLGRMAGVKDTDYTTSVFRDVPDGEWYTSFVAWATENGIVDGYGDGIFLPQNNITRQEMAKIMAKYLNWKGLDTTVVRDLVISDQRPEHHRRLGARAGLLLL